MGLLTRAMLGTVLDAAPPLVMEKVPCPEWSNEANPEAYVYVKMLTCAEAEAQERIALEVGREAYGALAILGVLSPGRAEALNLDQSLTVRQAQAIQNNPSSTRVPLLIATVCDDHGTCLFTNDDAEALAQQSPVLIKRLHDAAWKLNNTGADAVEEAVKNFASRQSNDSGVDLHSNGVCLSDSPSDS